MAIGLETFQKEIFPKAKNAEGINELHLFEIIKEEYCECAQIKGICPEDCSECFAFLQEQLDFKSTHNPKRALLQRMRTRVCILQEENSAKKNTLPTGFVDDHMLGEMMQAFLKK